MDMQSPNSTSAMSELGPLRPDVASADLDVRRHTEAEIEQRLRREHALFRLTAALARADTLEQVYACALDALLGPVPIDRASILLFDSRGIMRFQAWRGLSADYRQAVDGHSPWMPKSKNVVPVLVPDVEVEPALQGVLPSIRNEGIRALAFIPLVAGDRLLGRFMLYCDEPRPFGTDLVQFAQTVADHVAIAVERQRAQETLRESEERLSLAEQSADLGTWVWNLQAGDMAFSARWEEMLGYSSGEIEAHERAWEALVHPDDLQRVREVFAAHFEGRTPFYRTEQRMRSKNGDWKWVLDSGRIVARDENGTPVRAAGIQLDITERKILEQGLDGLLGETARVTGEEFFRELVCQLAIAFHARLALVANLVAKDPPRLRTLACSRDGILLESFEFDATGTPCEAALRRGFAAASHRVRETFPQSTILAGVQAVSFVGVALRDESGDNIGVIGVICDQPIPIESRTLTMMNILAARTAAELARRNAERERQRAEEAIRHSEERYRSLYNNNPSMYFTVNPAGTVLSVNRFGAACLGYEPEDLIGEPVLSLFVEDDKEVVRQTLAAAFAAPERVVQGEYRKVTREGSVIWVRETVRIVPSESGPVALIVCEDSTARKHAEENLRRTYDQMLEFGIRLAQAEEAERQRIALELHDEFGQALTAWKLDLAWLRKRLAAEPGADSRPALLDKVGTMTQATDDMFTTLRRVSTTLRPPLLDDLGLVAAIEWLAEDHETRTGHRCTVSVDPEAAQREYAPPEASTLFRVAQELLTNVMRHADASAVGLTLREEEQAAVLEVIDDGRGISDDQSAGRESLGLRGIRERVSRFGGTFNITRGPDGGTVATVRLPSRPSE